jgi:hypothetical protein
MARFSLCDLFRFCNALERLYIVHPDDKTALFPLKELKKLVIYCLESSRNVLIEGKLVGLRRNIYIPVRTNAIRLSRFKHFGPFTCLNRLLGLLFSND